MRLSEWIYLQLQLANCHVRWRTCWLPLIRLRRIANRNNVTKGPHFWRDSIEYCHPSVRPFQIKRKNRRKIRKRFVIWPTLGELRRTYFHLLSSGFSGVLNPDTHKVALAVPDGSSAIARNNWRSDSPWGLLSTRRMKPRLAPPHADRIFEKSHYNRKASSDPSNPLRKSRWCQSHFATPRGLERTEHCTRPRIPERRSSARRPARTPSARGASEFPS